MTPSKSYSNTNKVLIATVEYIQFDFAYLLTYSVPLLLGAKHTTARPVKIKRTLFLTSYFKYEKTPCTYNVVARLSLQAGKLMMSQGTNLCTEG